jgi:hypothetical protein
MAEPSCQYPVIGDRCRCPECVGFHQTTAASLRDERPSAAPTKEISS